MNRIEKSADNRLRVFLSHSLPDKDRVRELYHRLEKDGFRPWLDEEELLPGQNWKQEIEQAIRDADVVLVFVSRQALSRSGFFHREIRYALEVALEQPEDRIFLIPVKIDKCDVPPSLRQWQWSELYKRDGYDRLVRALKLRDEYTKIDEKHKGARAEIEDHGVGELNDPGKGSAFVSDIDTHSLVGEYRVEGINEAGQVYRGRASIKKHQEIFYLLSFISKQTHLCKGKISGDRLIVDGDYSVSYHISEDGKLSGRWGKNGTESLCPSGKRA